MAANSACPRRPASLQISPWRALRLCVTLCFDIGPDGGWIGTRQNGERSNAKPLSRKEAWGHPDTLSLEFQGDPDHSLDERRFVTFGMSSSGRLLVVAHAQHEDAIRIITARIATRAERKLYEEG